MFGQQQQMLDSLCEHEEECQCDPPFSPIMSKSFLLAALLAVAPVTHSLLAQANQAPKTNWTGDGDGKSWSQGANWSTGHPPTAEEFVTVTAEEVTVQGINNEAGILSFSKTTLVIEAGAELHVAGGGNGLSFITMESDIRVHGKLFLNTLLILEQSTITVDGSGLIHRETEKGNAALVPFVLNLVGDKAAIKGLPRFGTVSDKPFEMNVNITLGPNGAESIDAQTLILKEGSILTVDVSKYKPKPGGAPVILFTCEKLSGRFETANVTGGTGKIQYGATEVTLTDIVVKP